jgi:translation initiation factor IF-1
MVKNTFGGNKHKSQARKFTTNKPSNKLRIAEVDGEIYCVVTKMLGNSMFYAYGIDDVGRLGHIRGKFSGRGKRDNIVEVGKWVLLGEREWDIKKDRQKTGSDSEIVIKCDLLEVYNDLDKERLKDSVDENWYILISKHTGTNSKGNENNNTDELFKFTNEREEESQKILDELANNRLNIIDLKRTTQNPNEDANDWIDIDDI